MTRLKFSETSSASPRDGAIIKHLNNGKTYKHKKFLKQISDQYQGTQYSFPSNYMDASLDDLCNKPSKGLNPQQKFVADFMRPENPSKGLLIYHGLGSGKTCTGIVAGEALKSIHTGSGKIAGRAKYPGNTDITPKVIIAVPAQLKEQWKKEIMKWCPRQVFINGIPQNYTKDYRRRQNALQSTLDDINQRLEDSKAELRDSQNEREKKRLKKSIVSDEKKVKALNKELKALNESSQKVLKQTYEILSHDELLRGLYTSGTTRLRTAELINNGIPSGGNPLKIPNGCLIIDEIQRLVSATGINYKKLYYALKYHAHPSTKVVLLSATPIYDKPYEAGLTLNLLRPRIEFPSTPETFNEMFLKNTSAKNVAPVFTPKNKRLFVSLAGGYVSYFSGGNPKAFPFKTTTTMTHKMSSHQFEQYFEVLKSEIKLDNDRKGPGAESMMSLMSDDGEDTETMNVYPRSQQFCNIALPGVQEMWNKRKGKKGLSSPGKAFVIGKDVKAADITKEGISTLVDEMKSSSDPLKILRIYSPKYAKIVELVTACPGPAFIFSNFLDYGVNALGAIFGALGWSNFQKTGLKRSGPRYAIWSGETTKGVEGEAFRSGLMDVFNRDSNSDGSLIKVVLGTRSIMEGVSFRNVRQVHICDAWWNSAKIEQISARAIRNCSHSKLSIENQHVHIFKHTSCFPSYDQENYNQRIHDYLEELEAGGMVRQFQSLTVEQYMYKVSNQKSELTNQFNNLLKTSAIDCELNKHGNLGRLEELYTYRKGFGSYLRYYKHPTTKKWYGRVDPASWYTGSPVSKSFLVQQSVMPEHLVNNYLGYNTLSESQKSQVRFKELSFNANGDAILGSILNVSAGLIIKENMTCFSGRGRSLDYGSKEIKAQIKKLYHLGLLNERLGRLVREDKLMKQIRIFLGEKDKKNQKLRTKLRKLVTRSNKKLTGKMALIEQLILRGDYEEEHRKLLMAYPEEKLREILKNKE